MIIRINLLGERQKKGGKTALWLGLYLVSLFCLVVIFFFQLSAINAELAEKEGQIGLLEAQLNKLKVVTKEVRDLAEKRQNLSEKIAVMAALRKKKTGPVRVMDDLNFSIPERSWLTEVKELEGGLLKISGFALDFETISSFLKNLQASDYFSLVDLVDSKKAVVKGISITEFVIQGKVNYMGKLLPDESPVVLPASGSNVTGQDGAVKSDTPAAVTQNMAAN